MLQIAEHTPDRLVVREHAPGTGAALMLFVLGCLALMVLLPAHNIILIWRDGGMNPPLQILALLILLAAGCACVGLGLPVALGLLRGSTCVFDRPSATIHLTRLHHLRPRTIQYPLYGVSHTRVATNDETRSHALYLVLRSGEEVLLASASVFEAEAVERVRQQVWHFLRL